MGVTLRRADSADADTVWHILRPAVESGETLCAEPNGGREGGLAYFWPETAQVWIAEVDGTALGCFYLRPNQTGHGDHVCNAGYCTRPEASGQGVARAMLDFSLSEARQQGYRAMQYNFVVSTNLRAVATWEKAGFSVVGRLPGAFRHPTKGYVDALVMWKDLVDAP